MALVIALVFLIQPHVNADPKNKIPQPQYNDDALIASDAKFGVEELIRYYWKEEADTAIKIFKCESGLNEKAINWGDALITGMPSQGIAQINAPYNEKLFEYEYNLEVAYKMYQRRGWQPWTCFTLINAVK